MSTIGGANIVRDGLVLCLDSNSERCYSGSGNNWVDLINNIDYSGMTTSWAYNIYDITICVFLQKIGTSTGFASHPINKWNGGTGNASFVLYHFGTNNGTATDGRFYFYFTPSNTSWTGQYVATLVNNDYAFICFQYNGSRGCQIWLNNDKVGARGSINGGLLGLNGNNASPIISGPTSDGLTKVYNTLFYNRELSDAEIIQNYNAHKLIYNLK